MKAKRVLIHIFGGILATILTGVIHYNVHAITEINTFWSAVAVAFSFWPGMLIGYLVIYLKERGGDDDPAPPVTAVICALFWFVYLFRAATLLIGLPILSNWTQKPVDLLVKFFEFFI